MFCVKPFATLPNARRAVVDGSYSLTMSQSCDARCLVSLVTLRRSVEQPGLGDQYSSGAQQKKIAMSTVDRSSSIRSNPKDDPDLGKVCNMEAGWPCFLAK